MKFCKFHGCIVMSHNDGLYKWDRITKPRVYSRSQRVKTNDDIEDWIKKVEDASSKAAAETFGTKYIAPRRETREKVKATVQNAQIHEAAYAEAHDLLNEWVTQKLHLGDELEDYVEDSHCIKTQADVKREWDDLISSEADLELEDLEAQRSSAERKAKINKDPYSVLYKDNDELVNEVLDTMWEKDIYGDTFKQNLELEPEKLYDPTTKMKLRHQQVKENRDKRLRQKEKKLKELQMKKDSQFKARQIIMKEEKNKAMQKKKEEEEIQRNMAQIRKELEEERRKQKEEIARQKEEREVLARQAEAELQRQRDAEVVLKRKAHQQTEDRRQQILNKMKEIQTRQAKERLQILQKYFSGWYSVLMERRLAMGKAKATADWKLLLRTFNAWKAYTRAKHLDKQTLNHEQSLKQLHRKNNMADQYYRQRLMSKCFVAWQLFVTQQLSQRLLEEDSKVTKDKMAAFLQAAASGSLWSERKNDTESLKAPEHQKSEHLDALFKHSPKPRGTFSLNSTERNEVTGNKPSKKVDTPHEPWQITRKHLQLTKKQISNMGQASGDKHSCTCPQNRTNRQNDKIQEDSQSHLCSNCSPEAQNVDSEKEAKSGKKPWAKSAYSVNNFEHRHAAQQKILEMQQKQIKEQQKLIEELQYLQKQQMLQQQLLQQENVKRQMGGGGASQSAETIQNTLTGLQEHIQRLQQQLMAGTSPLQHCSPDDAAFTPANLHSGPVQNSERTQVQDIEVRDFDDEEKKPNAQVLNTAYTDSSLKLDLSSVNNIVEGANTSEDKKSSTINSNVVSTAKSTVSSTTISTVKVPSSRRGNAPPSTSRTAADNTRHSEFLRKMEERALDRTRIKQERELKKRREEEERMEKLLAEEEEMRRVEEEQKKQRLEEHRQKKRLEKQRELEKQQFAEKMKTLTAAADAHCRKAQLKYRGWLPWRKLIQNLREKENIAQQHYERSLQRTCLHCWHKTVTEELTAKNKMADQFHTYLLFKQAFARWCQIKEASAIQELKAIRHFESKMKLKVLRIWADYAAEEKVSMWHKERIAKEHNTERIKKKYFRMLQQFPVLRREEELRERRRQEMRKKVSNLLPDFRASQTDNI